MEKFYVSTSAVYTNAPAHIGFAHELIAADVLARYHRFDKKVFFLTGTDEHGLKIYRTAIKSNRQPKEFNDNIVKKVKKLKKELCLSYDYFSRTTDLKHIKAVQKLWLTIQEKSDIKKRKYAGWYCTGCEAFKTKKEIISGKCSLHPNLKLEWIKDENYFFKLSKYTQFIKDYLLKHPYFIIPRKRHNEILQFLEEGLKDVSISRSKKLLPWGIPVPNDPEQVMYCWFDALTFYISSVGYLDQPKKFKKWWESNTFKLHIIGKDINRFHSCLWISMLASAKLHLPNNIFVHGFITSNGKRMSKSKGNVIDPIKMVKKYGVDAFRYFLLSEGDYANDIDFTEKKLKIRYNSDLANGLGNLVARIAKLCETNKLDVKKLKYNRENKIREEIKKYLDNLRFDKALDLIWKYISSLDKYLDKEKPWDKNNNEAKKILGKIIVGSEAVTSILEIAETLEPFLPETSSKIKEQFKGPKIKAEKPLFPRIN